MHCEIENLCHRHGLRKPDDLRVEGQVFFDLFVLFNVAEADAAISTGSLDRPIELPAMDKVIGPYRQIRIFPFPGAAPVDACAALPLEARDVMIGGADLWGQGMAKCVDF